MSAPIGLRPSQAIPARGATDLAREYRKSRRSMTYSLEPEYLTAISDLVGLSHGMFITATDVANEVIRTGLPLVYAQVQAVAPIFNFLNEQRRLYEGALARQRVLGSIEELRGQVRTLMDLRTASAYIEAQRLVEAQRIAFAQVPAQYEAYYFWAREGLRLIDREIQTILTPQTRGALSLLPRNAIREEE